MNEINTKINEVETSGFTLLESCFTSIELDRYRGLVEQYLLKGDAYKGEDVGRPAYVRTNAFEYLEEIQEILANRRIHDFLTALIGEEVCYCHHSDMHLNWTGGWHRDSVDKDVYFDFSKEDLYRPHPVDGDTYAVYKVAVYLQESNEINGGLYVIPGSHSKPGVRNDFGEGKIIEAKPGDAVLFDTRLYHKGATVGELRRLMSDPSVPNRMSIFYSFSRNNEFGHDFTLGTIWRQNRQNDSTYVLNKTLKANLEKYGYGVMPYESDPKPDVEYVIEKYMDLKAQLALVPVSPNTKVSLTENDALQDELDRIKLEKQELGARLTEIETSKRYQFASKLADFVNTFR